MSAGDFFKSFWQPTMQKKQPQTWKPVCHPPYV